MSRGHLRSRTGPGSERLRWAGVGDGLAPPATPALYNYTGVNMEFSAPPYRAYIIFLFVYIIYFNNFLK